MKRIFLWLLPIVILSGINAQNKSESEIKFIVASDMGRLGDSEQKTIAGLMARCVDEYDIDFIAVAGDPIHDNGVVSVDDEEWNVKIENIYNDPVLHSIPWYIVSGNHEYNGNVQAILDYSEVSVRWQAPARYFSMRKHIKEGDNEKYVLFVFIDTTPLIDKYRSIDDKETKYSDAGEQCMETQLVWLDSVLVTSNDLWKIVIGHHPVYAKTNKSKSERTDMQARVGTILEKHNVDFYICGHIHNFQHINPEGSNVNYIVNSSASQSRPIHKIDEVAGVLFTNPDPGFTIFTVSEEEVRFFFVNHKGERVYDL